MSDSPAAQARLTRGSSLPLAIALGLCATSTLLVAADGAAPAWFTNTALEFLTRPGSWGVLLALVAFLGLVLVAYWWPRRRGIHHVALVAAGVMTASTVVLGLGSYWMCSGDQSPVWTQVSLTILLFFDSPAYPFGEVSGCPAAVPLSLQAARILGPAVLSLGLVSVVVALSRRGLDRARVRSSREIVLVLGVGEDGVDYVTAIKSSLRSDVTLAVLDADVESPACRQLRTLGVPTIEGSPDDPGALWALVVHRGRCSLGAVHLVSSDPAVNLDRLDAVRQAVDGVPAASNAAKRALVRIDDPWAAEEWRRQALDVDGWVLDAVGVHEATARELVRQVRDAGCDHLLLCGHDQLALAILAEVAQVHRESVGLRRILVGAPHLDSAIDEPDAPPVTILNYTAPEVADNHALRQRRFGNTVGTVAVSTEPPTREHVEGLLRDFTRPAVILSDWVGEFSTTLGVELAARHPDWWIYSRALDARGISARPLIGQLRTFTPSLQLGTCHEDTWERLARRCHQAYLARYGTQDRPAARPWGDLDPFYRESNTRQITTLLTSATAVGFSWGAMAPDDTSPDPEPTDAQLHTMAAAEHESWLGYYHARGWRHGPSRDEGRMVHPDLLPWDELTEQARAKTIDGVKDTLQLLATTGYHLRGAAPTDTADDGGWRTFHRSGTVHAEQQAEPWTWTTSDGQELRGSAGDWLITGEDGQQWSITDDQLHRTYAPLGDGQWQRIGSVQARQTDPGEIVPTSEGPYTCNLGDWVVRNPDGHLWAVPQDHFSRVYAPDRPPRATPDTRSTSRS